MKLLVVTSLKEYQKDVASILDEAGVAVFSVSETIGFKDTPVQNLADHWFSSGRGHFDSIFLFSFTEESRAERSLAMIQEYNAANATGFPIRGFVIPVDQSTYPMS